MHPVRLLIFALAATCLFAACAHSEMPPQNPDADKLPTDESSALAQLDRAEAELAQALGSRPTVSKEAIVTSPLVDAPPPPEAEPARKSPAGSGLRQEETELQSESRLSSCQTACRALASMQRATDHLCGLSGETDDRCLSARARVQNANQRVQASCLSC